MAITSFIY